jgi:hypothetical protein
MPISTHTLAYRPCADALRDDLRTASRTLRHATAHGTMWGMFFIVWALCMLLVLVVLWRVFLG